MAKYQVSGGNLTDIADAIRTKGGTSESLSFPDGFVSAIGAIPTGGGSALITKTITANGTYNASSDSADGYSSVTVNVPIVTGKFTPNDSAAGTAINISVPYTGNGYPILAIIYPTSGAYNSSSAIYSAVSKKATVVYYIVKSIAGSTPDYNANTDNNFGFTVSAYKASDSDPTSYTTSNPSKTARVYSPYSADGSATVRFNNNNSMSIFVKGSDTYGFLPETEYIYVIQYSA